MSTVNPGTAPVEGATESTAEANTVVFVAAVLERGGVLAGPTTRDLGADVDGRYGFLLPAAGGATIRVLMPGAPLALVRDGREATVPCLRINDLAWWWNDAVGQAAGLARPPE